MFNKDLEQFVHGFMKKDIVTYTAGEGGDGYNGPSIPIPKCALGFSCSEK